MFERVRSESPGRDEKRKEGKDSPTGPGDDGVIVFSHQMGQSAITKHQHSSLVHFAFCCRILHRKFLFEVSKWYISSSMQTLLSRVFQSVVDISSHGSGSSIRAARSTLNTRIVSGHGHQSPYK